MASVATHGGGFGLMTVFISSPDVHSERRFDRGMTIGQLKAKLQLITGIPFNSQRLSVEGTGSNLEGGDIEARSLEACGVREGNTIRVTDADPSRASSQGQFTDVSQVEKFELSEAEYAQRRDTVLAFKQRNKLGRFANSTSVNSSTSSSASPSVKPTLIPIGSRCEVDLGGSLLRRGTIKFVGETEFGGGGIWVGVEYDEAVGKNDGSVAGKRYFSTGPSRGAFVRPGKVRLGDFKEIDIMDELDEM